MTCSCATDKNKRIVDQTDTQIETKSTEVAVLNVNIQRKDSEIESLRVSVMMLSTWCQGLIVLCTRRCDRI